MTVRVPPQGIGHRHWQFPKSNRFVEFGNTLTPTSKLRPRVTGKRVRAHPKAVKYERHLKFQAEEAMRTYGRSPFDCPVWVQIIFSFQFPKTWPESWKQDGARWHTGKPDVDNLGKAVLDACNGIVYKDDSQVCLVRFIKAYGSRDEVLVAIGDFA